MIVPHDKAEHALGCAAIFCLVYMAVTRWWRFCPIPAKTVALVVAVSCALIWEVGQLLLGHPAGADMAGDLIADAVGIGVMWGIAF